MSVLRIHERSYDAEDRVTAGIAPLRAWIKLGLSAPVGDWKRIPQ